MRTHTQHGCHNVESLRCDAGTQQHTVAKENREAETAPLLETVFIPTAVGYAHARSRTHARAPFVAVTKGEASSAAVVPWLPSL